MRLFVGLLCKQRDTMVRIKNRLFEINLKIKGIIEAIEREDDPQIIKMLEFKLMDLKDLKRINEAILYQNPELYKQTEYLH